jgi:hypothetical protein
VVSQDFAQGHIQRLNGIGRVDGFANVSREAKEGDNPLPVGHPGFADGGIAVIPLRGKVHQGRFSVGGRGGAIDGLEVGGHRFTVFIGDVAQRIAHQVNDAQLHPGLRKDRFNGLGKAREPIHTGDKDIFHTSILEFRQH